MGFLYNCHRWLLCLPVAYVVFILCLGIPYIQRGAIYLHWVRIPVQANFDAPEFYGIPPGQVRNFQLTTPDGAKIGVWHALPEAVYVRHFQQSENYSGSLLQSDTEAIPLSVFENALRTHKSVLYSHGNAASRAQSSRASILRAFSATTYGACDEGLNFVIYDYRGFADSSPSSLFPPSEEGLIKDARTVWDYMVGSGANPRNISIIGQSLGTGVSAALAHRLITEENVTPNSLCLIAPFTSIPELLKTYSLFKFIPILQPLSVFPKAQSWLLDTFLTTHFNTKAIIPSITTNIMLIHAQDDIDVHPSHSKSLFEYIHEHHSTNVTIENRADLPILLPSPHKQSHLSPTPIPPSSDDRFKPVVTTHKVSSFGKLHQFKRIRSGSQVIFLDAQRGGHNWVGYSGTSIRAMTEMICKPSS
ncbi:uncharacterized protein PGTG_16438 [Puccinia graminis f. sp. tritici CRL 75-36-700-3]|uniref:Serine aminopeptidase S33 domain-containing protein n=1 Tax=Puccinia graminis f. sp. tritici (strain CRL 75-36-700-3 / race SCCL) TaxID=418459 RepID=E3L0T5_PUCGT|nr:uncharacterized protein PGTG_16438 [Puccinia graminis f. sp. tritici CRL 75-36-700-3]EFP90160.2 hypothetical protein PGTG_16438 [Puccinia graminis f. sp. tritici CRL 75-36-700-3]